jgi:hypothetical protein
MPQRVGKGLGGRLRPVRGQRGDDLEGSEKMSYTRKVRLWLIAERPLARMYSKLSPERNPGQEDMIWVPRSIVEGCTKFGNEHHLTLPEWFCDEKNL